MCAYLRTLWNLFLVLTRDGHGELICIPEASSEIKAEIAIRDDFASRKARTYKKYSSPRQKFVHFGPVTEIDQQKWKRLSIGKAGPRKYVEVSSHGNRMQTSSSLAPASDTISSICEDQRLNPQSDYRYFFQRMCAERDAWKSSRCCF